MRGTYCECPFPIDYHGSSAKCGRCFRRREPEPDFCPTCEGEGQVLAHMAITSPHPRPDLVKCPHCLGSGEFRETGATE